MIGDDEFDDEGDNEVKKKSWNPSKSKNLSKSKKTELGFLISRARMAFTKLSQAFIKALIRNHFDLERHIRVDRNVLGYAISGVLSQLTLDDLSLWYPIVFFL